MNFFNCDGKNNLVEFIFAHYDYKMFTPKDFFLKIGIVEIFLMKSFILQNYNCKNPLNEFLFFSNYCDCRNFKDNLSKINYDCRNHDFLKKICKLQL